MNIEDKLPKAEDVLNDNHKRVIKRDGVESIHTPDFPVAYREQAILAMHEYASRLLDVAVEDICKKEWRDTLKGHYDHKGQWVVTDKWKPIELRPRNPTGIEFRELVINQSILKLKEMLK